MKMSIEHKTRIIREFINRSFKSIYENQSRLNRVDRFELPIDGVRVVKSTSTLIVKSKSIPLGEDQWRISISSIDLNTTDREYPYYRDGVRGISLDEFQDIFKRRPLIFLNGVKLRDSSISIVIDDNNAHIILDQYSIYGVSTTKVDIILLDVGKYTYSNDPSVDNLGKLNTIGFRNDGSIVDITVNSNTIDLPNDGYYKSVYSIHNLNPVNVISSNSKGYFSGYNAVSENNILAFKGNVLLSSNDIENLKNTVFRIKNFDSMASYKVYILGSDNSIMKNPIVGTFKSRNPKIEEFYIKNLELIDSILNIDYTNFDEIYNISDRLTKGKSITEYIDDMLTYICRNFSKEVSPLLAEFLGYEDDVFNSILLTPNYIAENTTRIVGEDIWGADETFSTDRLRIEVKNKKFKVLRNGVVVDNYVYNYAGYDLGYIYLEEYDEFDIIDIRYEESISDGIDSYTFKAIVTDGELIVDYDSSKYYIKSSDIFLYYPTIDSNVGTITDIVTSTNYDLLRDYDLEITTSKVHFRNIPIELGGLECLVVIPPPIVEYNFKYGDLDLNKSIIVDDLHPFHIYSSDRMYVTLNATMQHIDFDYEVGYEPIIENGEIKTKLSFPNVVDVNGGFYLYYDYRRRVIYDDVRLDTNIITILDLVPYSRKTHRVWVDSKLINQAIVRQLSPYTIKISNSEGERVIIETYTSNSDMFDDFKDQYVFNLNHLSDNGKELFYRSFILEELYRGKYINSENSTYIDYHSIIDPVYDLVKDDVLLDLTSKSSEEIKPIDILFDISKPTVEYPKYLDRPYRAYYYSRMEYPTGLESEMDNVSLDSLTLGDKSVFFRALLLDKLYANEYTNDDVEWVTKIEEDYRLNYLYGGDNILLDLTAKKGLSVNLPAEPILIDICNIGDENPTKFPNQEYLKSQIEWFESLQELSSEQLNILIRVYLLRKLDKGEIIRDAEVYSGGLCDDLNIVGDMVAFDLRKDIHDYTQGYDIDLIIDASNDTISHVQHYPNYDSLIGQLIKV